MLDIVPMVLGMIPRVLDIKLLGSVGSCTNAKFRDKLNQLRFSLSRIGDEAIYLTITGIIFIYYL